MYIHQMILEDGASLLVIGDDHVQISESELGTTVSSDEDPKRIEAAYAFSKHPGSNFSLSQSANKILQVLN